MNNWIPLLSTLAGGILAISGGMLIEWTRNNNRRKALAYAFLGEMQALLRINEARGYRTYLTGVISNLNNGHGPQQLFKFSINDDNYFLVYKRNVENIGILPADICTSITLGYSLIFSFLEDVKTLESMSEDQVTKDHLLFLANSLQILEGSITEAENATSLIKNKKWWF